MRARGAGAAFLATAAIVLTGLVGCGGGGAGESAAERLTEARAYAADVNAITQRTSTSLAAIAGRADYRDAAAAAGSTRAYAAVIRTAAAALGRATPPQQVAADHRALVVLYRETGGRMDDLAAAFTQARGEEALTASAQRLSGEVQRLSTRERALRSAIERGLPSVTASTPEATGGEVAQPTGPEDPG
ncbi:MAG: hypothetical protein Q7T55_04260 [Solirubrobacteraceae bacterium]|nr:hypothetical protein [Solirubrobacteraceae bacterium]